MKQDAVKMKPRSKNEARCSTFHTPPNACYYGRVQVGKKEEMVRCVTLTIKNYSRIPYCIPKKLFLLSNTLQQSAPETQLACRHANIINKRGNEHLSIWAEETVCPFTVGTPVMLVLRCLQYVPSPSRQRARVFETCFELAASEKVGTPRGWINLNRFTCSNLKSTGDSTKSWCFKIDGG